MTAQKFLSGIDLASQKATNLADGSSAADAATYGQLLNMVNGKDYKDSVRAASTANVTLTAPGTSIDGVTLAANDRVLLKNQTTASQNGIWVWNTSSTSMTRPVDFPTGATSLVTQGATVVVDEGSSNAASQWTLTTTGVITVDTTSQAWTRTTAAGASYTGGNGISISTGVVTAVADAGKGISVGSGGIAADRTKVPFLFAQDVGDGSTTAIDVTHNLGTLDVIVQVRDKTTGAEVFVDNAPKSGSNVNVVTLTFATAPASNAYRVIIHG